MKIRALAGLTVILAAVVLAGGLITSPAAAQDGSAEQGKNTEDVIYMSDGRVLHGKILEETDDTVRFEYIDRDTNIRGVRTFQKSEIAEIERDVPVKTDTSDKDQDTPEATSKNAGSNEPGSVRRFGVSRSPVSDERVPSFYIVPMKGQMGTDITARAYEEVIEDIKEVQPDVIIIKMKCEDKYSEGFELKVFEQGLANLPFMDDYRDMVNLFRDELSHIRQVLWVEDAYGISSVAAFAWGEMYMMPDAKLGRMDIVRAGYSGIQDENVLGKYREAWMAMVKSFLEYGDYPLVLADAMVRPQYMLSGSFKGRTVEWRKDLNGEFIVDFSPKHTLQMNAKIAEDLTISDGTAKTIEDLALLLGYREFRVLDERGVEIWNDYKDAWRTSFERCKVWLDDALQFERWAQGEDTLKYLGRAKNRYEDILAKIERYPAVEIRMAMERGITKFSLVTKIEMLKERIRALREAERNGRGGGRRGGGGGMGAGG